MILTGYSIYDEKGESYGPPHFFHNSVSAKRGFTHLATEPSLDFGRYPKDFTVYATCEFDPDTGTIVPLSPHQYRYKLSDLVTE